MRRLCREASAVGAPPDAIARVWRSLCGDVRSRAASRRSTWRAGTSPCRSRRPGAISGSAPTIVPLVGIRDALERAVTDAGLVSCVPWPEHAGAGQWWPMLNENRFRDLNIVAGWPSLPGSPTVTPRMAIVGRIGMESSGDDDTLATAHDDHYTADKRLQGDLGSRRKWWRGRARWP